MRPDNILFFAYVKFLILSIKTHFNSFFLQALQLCVTDFHLLCLNSFNYSILFFHVYIYFFFSPTVKQPLSVSLYREVQIRARSTQVLPYRHFMATAYLRVSLLMGIPIPHTLVQTSKISLIRVRSLVQLTLTICMNLLLHTAMISKISAMMRTLLSIGSGSLTNLPKQKTNSIFGGYTPKPLQNQ